MIDYFNSCRDKSSRERLRKAINLETMMISAKYH
jgi:hypothetical protein